MKKLIKPVGHKLIYRKNNLSKDHNKLYVVYLENHFDELHAVIHQNDDAISKTLPHDFKYPTLIRYLEILELSNSGLPYYENYGTIEKRFEL